MNKLTITGAYAGFPIELSHLLDTFVNKRIETWVVGGVSLCVKHEAPPEIVISLRDWGNEESTRRNFAPIHLPMWTILMASISDMTVEESI